MEAQAKPARRRAGTGSPNRPPHRANREPSAAGAVADRWVPMNQFATPAPRRLRRRPRRSSGRAAAPHRRTGRRAAADTADAEPPIEEVAEGSVPAIAGPAPLPRRKPTITAARRVETTTPLPRPRPDGPAPQSVWTGVPSTDERFTGQ